MEQKILHYHHRNEGQFTTRGMNKVTHGNTQSGMSYK